MPAVTLEHYLLVAAVLFAIGAVGVVVRRNALILLMSIELMLNSVNLTLVAASRFNGDLDGQAMALFVMAVAAAEAAVGLAIVIAVFRTRRTANIDELTMLEG
ncbi:MAG: NADH-quinone oxidoreductase subunit NuoK [Deltaproteobacteria bacterium]|nr:MAG: NADH-quinone oxidoreductase subunit NuoK [Deltaproteobacteria bacterium]